MDITKKLLMNMQELEENGAITIVVFGDSVSHGALGNDEIDYETVYWNRLKQKINAIRNYVPVNVINASIGGTTAAMSLGRMDKQVLVHNPDLLIVCFGLNDVNGDKEEYLNALEQIFAKGIDSGAQTVFMTPNMLNTYVAEDTLPELKGYAAVTADAQNSGKVDAYMNGAIEVAQRMGIAVCDCYSRWKELSKTQDVTKLLANRINHPTREMHELFAQSLFEMLFKDKIKNCSSESTMYVVKQKFYKDTKMYKNIRPGKVWYDTNGKRIQAHGGSILYAEGKYWWYGENKEGIRGSAMGEKCPFWHHGVRLYSSTDLYNWQDEGFVVKESDNPENPFYPKNLMDRPHILYNEKTKQYVLWAKTSVGTFDECNFSVCVGESLKNMRYVKDVRYKDITVGDFDMFTIDGKGYVVYEHPHEYMVLQELTDDYQDLSPVYSTHLHFDGPPFIREAPAHFERNGRHFLLTSGTSGYFPNESICYDITDLHGEWKDLGNPCVNDVQKNSFHAQYSSVFKHPTIKDLYIALGDRWLTDISIDLPDIQKVIMGIFEKEGGIKIPNNDLSIYSDENTEEANYVWLPIKFKEDGTPYIAWVNKWDTENF